MRFVKLGGDLVARPLKQGVDYFPLDVYLDDKFKFIEIKYKLEGFAILVKLMQRIYSQGYWCRWTDDELLLFSDDIRADTQLVKDVGSECLERDIFNKHLYDSFNILTSKGIQKRYKEIVRRRKEVEVTEEYLLIDNILKVNDVNNPSSSKHNDDKSTQRKGKESKGKNDKQKYLDHVRLKNDEYNRLIDEYGKQVIDSKIEDLDTYISNKGKNPYKDHNKTLRNWIKRDGIKSKSETKKEEEPTIQEMIDSIDDSLSLGLEYFKGTKQMDRYKELQEAREKLEQQL